MYSCGKKCFMYLFSWAVLHSGAESSLANLIFSQHAESDGKPSDSTSLSLVSQSAASSESNVAARYWYDILWYCHIWTCHCCHYLWHATQDCIVSHINHILHRNQFWVISIASGSVRLWDLRSCCMMLSHVMRGRPRGLLQSSGGRANRILLASALLSICTMCPERFRWRDWTIAVSLGCPVSLQTSSFRTNWCHLIPISVCGVTIANHTHTHIPIMHIHLLLCASDLKQTLKCWILVSNNVIFSYYTMQKSTFALLCLHLCMFPVLLNIFRHFCRVSAC